jgi:hypothetical protein
MRSSALATYALLVCLSLPGHTQVPRPTANSARNNRAAATTPNILFIIMDDVGIDQMKVFGYGGATPAATPNIDAIAHAGVRFRNTWSMPECSPSRVIFFEGRYPLRTNVYNAILATDLANSQLSPYEVTTPELLKTVGYTSALFGKFHLGGPDYNPYGMATPHAAGFNYFDGFLEGAPYPIDTSIGGQFQSNSPYTCGFIPNKTDNPQYGADFGSCRFPNSSCQNISRDQQHPTPGRVCLDLGGLFVPNVGCDVRPPNLNFAQTNAYYVWKRVINYPNGSVKQFSLNDPSTRTYVSDVTTQSAVHWINQQNAAKQPWMATVSFANIHTPYQQPPTSLLPTFEREGSGLQCTGNSPANKAALRIISNQMLEAMDKEIGRVMVETDLATYNKDGSLNYHPEKTNTMVVIIGDNGTFAPGVKAPFDPNLAKGWVFQTGVWVPLIVAGPMVVSPNREINAMVNIADLFELWGEIVGIDVHQAVPHTIDSASMLPYLTNPHQQQIRKLNFTQTQSNIHFDDKAPPPCVVQLSTPPTCVQVFPQQQLCEFEGGIWYGPGGTHVYSDCCAVKNALYQDSPLAFLPDTQMSTRNSSYKLIQTTYPNCSTGNEGTFDEFYHVDQKPVAPLIDKLPEALCANPDDPTDQQGAFKDKQVCPGGLNPQQTTNYNKLLSDMSAIVASQPPCPGDGNEDLLVNNLDLTDFSNFAGGGSSWYDFDHDAVTNGTDRAVIVQNLGKNCKPQ